jgi:hypothetical protein
MKCITRILADADAAMATGLFDESDADSIRRIIRPYLERLTEALPPSVNSEPFSSGTIHLDGRVRPARKETA